ncbi:hypothetical protein [Pseudoalteromonas sp. OOF1S-7]|uniref:hypothetical protein n=1 Tax=Pseudoalteromonas sp. OOF1S-7 TaxID=2917757 RepID=UPI001EF441AD|nr:hypothetical protein [Pseudoalteromonas sp. OOF1S-7]MCG7536621.1 hypothetical protein [Pseudoalteromonas sp. OOF1S-7]
MLKVSTYILMGVIALVSFFSLLFYGNGLAYSGSLEASGEQVNAPLNVAELQLAITHEPEAVTSAYKNSGVRLPQHELQSTYYTINKESQHARAFFKSGTTVPYELYNEAYMELDVKSIRTLAIGDSFEFLIPQTQEKICSEIIDITETEQEKRLIGQVNKEANEHYQVHLTLTDDVIYGQIQLPSGNYVFESYGQYAWVAAKRNIHSTSAKSLSVHSLSDTENTSDVPKPNTPVATRL